MGRKSSVLTPLCLAVLLSQVFGPIPSYADHYRARSKDLGLPASIAEQVDRISHACYPERKTPWFKITSKDSTNVGTFMTGTLLNKATKCEYLMNSVQDWSDGKTLELRIWNTMDPGWLGNDPLIQWRRPGVVFPWEGKGSGETKGSSHGK